MIKIWENFKKEELFDCAAHNLLFSSPSFNPSEREPTLALLLRGPLWLSGSLKSAQTVWSGIFHRVIGAKERRLGRSWSLAKTPDFLLVSFDVIWDFFFSFLQEHTVAPLWTAPRRNRSSAAIAGPAANLATARQCSRYIYVNKETQQWCLLIPRDVFAAGREGN